jgi:hypothetical protein
VSSQECRFEVQVPGRDGGTRCLTVARAQLDLSPFVLFEGGGPQPKMVPLLFKVGGASTGYLRLTVEAERQQGPCSDDGMTDVSGATGLTAGALMDGEQDLVGFDEEATTTAAATATTTAVPTAVSQGVSGRSRMSQQAAVVHASRMPQLQSAVDQARVQEHGTVARPSDNDDNAEVSPISMSPNVRVTASSPCCMYCCCALLLYVPRL